MNIGERIKKARLAAGYTQAKLGARCGMADSAIRRYESGRGNPTLETLQRIADALDVPVGELIGQVPEPDREWEEIVLTLEDAGLLVEETGWSDGPDENGDHLYIWHRDAERPEEDRIEITYGELRRIMAETKRGAEQKARDYIHKRLEAELF